MAHQHDSLVVRTIARTTRAFAAQGTNAEAGVAYERALYADLLEAATWRHTAGPDEFDMGGLLQSRTGIHYEFDCALLATDALYVVEAKRHARITRQHISEFVFKLIDIVLGAASEVSAPAIMPIFVSGLPRVDDAAQQLAVSWGVPIIAPSRPTPWELLDSLPRTSPRADTLLRLVTECEAACRHLWRPINSIITAGIDTSGRFRLEANAVYDAQRVFDILEFWRDCQRSVESLAGAWRTP